MPPASEPREMNLKLVPASGSERYRRLIVRLQGQPKILQVLVCRERFRNKKKKNTRQTVDRARQACCVLTERSLRQQPTGKTRKCLAPVPPRPEIEPREQENSSSSSSSSSRGPGPGPLPTTLSPPPPSPPAQARLGTGEGQIFQSNG